MKQPISRRAALRGLGAAIALPSLEAMTPRAYAAAAPEMPMRMAFVFVPNGVHMPSWRPTGNVLGNDLPTILRPLAKVKDHVSVLTGLMADGAFAHGDGAGDHARSAGAFLTAAHPVKTGGANIRAGVSVDQVAAMAVGDRTRFASLELGCERGSLAGTCDSGYSCAYSHTISWRTPTLPLAKEVDPQLAFDRLFSNENPEESEESRAKRERYRQSILDFVQDDAKRLHKRLGKTDQRKMDEYLASIREIENRIERFKQRGFDQSILASRPKSRPTDYQEHIRLMFDLLTLAFRTDSTRIATLMIANEGSNRPYPFLNVPDGHHDLSHHGKEPGKLEKIEKINTFHMEQFAYFLDNLRSIKEGEHNLLDRTMIVYGSGISDGDRHNHDDLPVLFAGGQAKKFKGGQHIVMPERTPLANLFVSMLNNFGVPTQSFGDSRGPLTILQA